MKELDWSYIDICHISNVIGWYARTKMAVKLAGVLKEIPIKDRKAEVDLDRDYLPCSKTLGVWWLADEDVHLQRERTRR